MRKVAGWWAGLVLAAVAWVAPGVARAGPVAPADEPGFLAPAKHFAVKILRGQVPTAEFLGSGFTWMSRGRALAVTNLHVAQKGVEQRSSGAYVDGQLMVGYAAPVLWHAARAVLALPGSDLAVIETDVEAPQGTPYALGTAAPGETVYSVGYDEKGFETAAPVVFSGTVVGIGAVTLTGEFLALPPPYPPDAVPAYFIEGTDCKPGSSGSMILNSRGELVAYHQGRIEGGICIAMPIEELSRALERAGF